MGYVDSHGDRFSLPAVPELAGLLVGGFTTEVNRFDVVVETKYGTFRQIYPLNPSLMALQYPILFPHGDADFHNGIKMKIVDPAKSPVRENISMTKYYAYYAHYRHDELNPVLCSGRLLQQFVVNMFSCIESNRLSFYINNQPTFRSDTYQGITDAICKGASSRKDVSVKVVLPVSHIGGKQYMNQNFHDCMAICCAYDPLDKFTTMMCNPNWPEI
jgi:hypothetical protein